MRRVGALAGAALLVLALGVSGCDLVSSLTPFGIGHKDYGSGADSINGFWSGSTGTGGPVTFQVADSHVYEMRLLHATPECSLDFKAESSATTIIADDSFRLELNLTDLGQGRIVFEGRFTSSSTCAGSYFFKGRPAGICPTAGSGTFRVEKTL